MSSSSPSTITNHHQQQPRLSIYSFFSNGFNKNSTAIPNSNNGKPIPVLQRPWAIQKIMLFCVGRDCAFSVYNASRLASVCKDWDETMWELGTIDLILPKDFLLRQDDESKKSSGSSVGNYISSQQHFLMKESAEIMDRAFENETSIKLTKRVRRAFAAAGFNFKISMDATRLPMGTFSTIKISPHDETKRFDVVDLAAAGTSVSIFRNSTHLFEPFADKKYTRFAHFQISAALSLTNSDPKSHDRDSVSNFSPDGRFLALQYFLPIKNNDSRYNRYRRFLCVFDSNATKRKDGNNNNNNICLEVEIGEDDAPNSNSVISNNVAFSRDGKTLFASTKNDTISVFVFSEEKQIFHQLVVDQTTKKNSIIDPISAIGHSYDVASLQSTKDSNNATKARYLQAGNNNNNKNSNRTPNFCLQQFIQPSSIPDSAGALRLATICADGTIGIWTTVVKRNNSTSNNNNNSHHDGDGTTATIKVKKEKEIKKEENERPKDPLPSLSSSAVEKKTATMLQPTLKPQILLSQRKSDSNNKNHPTPVVDGAFFTLSMRFLSFHADGSLRVWDINTDSRARSLSGTKVAARTSSGVPIIFETSCHSPYSCPIEFECGTLSYFDDSIYACALTRPSYRGNPITWIAVNNLASGVVNAIDSGSVDAMAFPQHTSAILLTVSKTRKVIQSWSMTSKDGVCLQSVSIQRGLGYRNFTIANFACKISFAGHGIGKVEMHRIIFSEKLTSIATKHPVVEVTPVYDEKMKKYTSIEIEDAGGIEYKMAKIPYK